MKNYAKNPNVIKAFEEFYPRLKAIAYGVLHDKEEAEDVASHSFEKVLICDDIETMTLSQIGKFVRVTAARYTIDLLRKGRSGDRFRNSPEAKVAEYYEDAWVKESMFTEHCEALKEEISGLPTQQREILTEKFYEGKSTQEISWRFGIAKTTVNNTIRSAIINLRKRFSQRGIKW